MKATVEEVHTTLRNKNSISNNNKNEYFQYLLKQKSVSITGEGDFAKVEGDSADTISYILLDETSNMIFRIRVKPGQEILHEYPEMWEATKVCVVLQYFFHNREEHFHNVHAGISFRHLRREKT